MSVAKKKGGGKKRRWLTFRSVVAGTVAVGPPVATALAGNGRGVTGAIKRFQDTKDFGKALQEFTDVMSIEYGFYKPSDGTFWWPGQSGVGGMGLFTAAAGGLTYKALTWVKMHTGLRNVNWF